MSRFKKFFASTLGICMILGAFVVPGNNVNVVNADGVAPDPAATLQAAFATFNSSKLLYMDYIAPDGDAVVHEQAEVDRDNHVRKISSQDDSSIPDKYVDLNAKVTYIKNSSKNWGKEPADAKDLENIGRVAVSNGIEARVVPGVEYKYLGEEYVSVVVPGSDEEASVLSYHFEAEIPFSYSDDVAGEDYDDDDDEDVKDESISDEDVPIEDGEEVDETITVDYYVAEDTGAWVYACTDEVTLSIYYPAPGTIAATIPKEAKKKAALQVGYTMTYKGVIYKVVKKNKKNTLTVTGSKNKKKLNVEKTIKILGKKYKVTEIGANAFAKNKKLKTLTVKANIVNIGKQAFNNSKKISTITFKCKSIKTVGKNAFKNVPKKAVIKVPSNKKTAYEKLFTKAGFKGKVK